MAPLTAVQLILTFVSAPAGDTPRAPNVRKWTPTMTATRLTARNIPSALAHGLRPLEVPIRVGLGRHQRFHASLGQFFLELPSDERVLVGILDLILCPVLDFFGVTVKLHRG